jgi:hypothetical protein
MSFLHLALVLSLRKDGWFIPSKSRTVRLQYTPFFAEGEELYVQVNTPLEGDLDFLALFSFANFFVFLSFSFAI